MIQPLPAAVADNRDALVGPNTHEAWPIWHLVLRGVATLQEIESWWSLEQVWDAGEALDIQDAVNFLRRPPPSPVPVG